MTPSMKMKAPAGFVVTDKVLSKSGGAAAPAGCAVVGTAVAGGFVVTAIIATEGAVVMPVTCVVTAVIVVVVQIAPDGLLFPATGGSATPSEPEKEFLLNHNRRLERQGGQCLDMAALFRLDNMDRHPELLLEERRC